MPRVDYATYEIKKDKVIASLSKQNASVFTKIAKETKTLSADLEIMNAKKRELTEMQNKLKDRGDELNSLTKEKVIELFGESEQAMTLSVECLGSTFTLSKLAESNQDKIITKAGEIASTDYKAVVDELLIQIPEISEAVKLLIKQFSVIAESDIIKKGAERRLSVNLESIVQEGVWDKVLSIANRLAAKFKSLFSGLRSRQNKINSMLSKLNETTNKGKILEDVNSDVLEISKLTGVRKSALEQWISDNNINTAKLLKYINVKSADRLKNRMDISTAISGKPNNKASMKLKKLFSESNILDKIMLNKSEKQLVKEYAKKLISKRKLNENKYTTVKDADDLVDGDVVKFVKKSDKNDVTNGKILSRKTNDDTDRLYFTNIDYPNAGRCNYTKYSLGKDYQMFKLAEK